MTITHTHKISGGSSLSLLQVYELDGVSYSNSRLFIFWSNSSIFQVVLLVNKKFFYLI